MSESEGEYRDFLLKENSIKGAKINLLVKENK